MSKVVMAQNPFNPAYNAPSSAFSTRYLQPLVIFNGTVFESRSRTTDNLHSTVKGDLPEGSSGSADQATTPTDLETITRRMVREMQTLLMEESVTTRFSGDKSWLLTRNKKEYLWSHDTLQYIQAKNAYLELLKVASCLNANLDTITFSQNKNSLAPWMKSILQWANFPIMDIDESVRYVEETKDNKLNVFLDKVEVKVTEKVYDVTFGTLMSEITTVFIGKSVTDEELARQSSAGGSLEGVPRFKAQYPTLYDRYYRNSYLMSGSRCIIEIPSVHPNVVFGPESTTIVKYSSITNRIAEKRTEIWKNRLAQTSAEGVYNKPDVRLYSKATDTLLSSIPRLPKQDFTDFRDRYGLFGIGEMAVKLTARKLKLSSGYVNTVVQSIKEYRAYSSAEQLGNSSQALQAFGQSEMMNVINVVVNELSAAIDVMIPLISRDLDISNYKVQLVLQLYTQRFLLSDALTLIDFIPEVESIVDSYLYYEDNFLKLVSCQRNVDYQLISMGWSFYKNSGFGTGLQYAIISWIRIMRESESLFSVDYNSAANIWNVYISFVNKIQNFDTLKAYREMMTKMASYRRVSSSHINTLFDVHIGDGVKGHELSGRVQNVSFSLTGESGMPSVSITAVSLPDSFNPRRIL